MDRLKVGQRVHVNVRKGPWGDTWEPGMVPDSCVHDRVGTIVQVGEVYDVFDALVDFGANIGVMAVFDAECTIVSLGNGEGGRAEFDHGFNSYHD